VNSHLFDSRLARVLRNEPLKYATLNEYVNATGIPTHELLAMFMTAPLNEEVQLDSNAGEIFVRTNPESGLLPTLWNELLLERDEFAAAWLWQQIRTLERGGWLTEVRRSVLTSIFGSNAELAVRVQDILIPVLEEPSEYQELLPLAGHGPAAIAVVVAPGSLDDAVTRAREWFFNYPHLRPNIVLLERPGLTPLVVSSSDYSIAPRWVSMEELHNL